MPEAPATAIRLAITEPPSRSDHPPRLRRPPEWLWVVVTLAQLGPMLALTGYTYFFVDDYLFLRQAQTQAFNLAYLREGLFIHFSPVTRILNTLLVTVAPGDFTFARVVEMVLYVAAIAALAFVVRTVMGRTWGALALTIAFGQSLFFIRLLTWWTATANILPASIFMLVSFGCYLRWTEDRRWMWLVAALGCFVVALADYELAMVFPVYVVLIRLVVMQDSFDPRRWLKILWAERWIWLGYIVIDLLQIINFLTNYYQKVPKPTLGQDLHFLVLTAFNSFIPALVGYQRYPEPESPGALTLAWVLTVFFLALVAAVVVRPRAWRCLVVLVVSFVVSMLPLAFNRLVAGGVGVGEELFYQQQIEFVFVILTAFALSGKWGGSRPLPEALVRVRALRRQVGNGNRVAFASVLLAFIGYGVLFVTSARQIGLQQWQPRGTKAYVTHFRASAAAVRHRTGREPNLINADVPTSIMPASYVVYNEYDQFFHLVDSDVHYDQWSSPAFTVRNGGSLAQVRLTPWSTAKLAAAASSATPTGPAQSAGGDRANVCVHGSSPVWLHFPLRGRLRLKWVAGHGYSIGLRYESVSRVTVAVLVANAGGVAAAQYGDETLPAGRHAELVNLDVGLEPAQVIIEAYPGMCFNRVSVVSVRYP
jgi:hypothetical protein